MAKKPVTPAQIWQSWSGLGVLAFEAQSVINMRMLGMAGLWPVGKAENQKMLSEKPVAFAKASQAAAKMAASGGRPDEILAAAIAPLTRTARANRKRLTGGVGTRQKKS